ncbi:MAG TPA: RagB/SusD family nutrient uptake outer membrane protein, partial [Chitinophagaceae bacterium]|nr:RagB/SusD family nutrient uptake outer membrane protein [Chitinophagaceae bacterium]
DAAYYDETNYSLSETTGLGRIAASDIRKKLIVSLLDAEAKLPAKYSSANDLGRATKGAAQTLLVKLYLWEKQWDLAQKEAQAIVDGKVYTLMTNYADIFLEANEFNTEMIFEVDFESVLNGNDHHTWYEPQKQVGIAPFNGRSWYGNYVPYTTFSNSFDNADKRKALIIATSYNGTAFKIDPVEKIPAWFGSKFWRLTYPSDTDGGMDAYVFRFADVLLMLAEAANENNDPTKALSAVNLLRPREGLPNFTTNMTQQDMRDYIFAERARELVGEGHRRLDLIRWGKLVSAVKTAAATEEPVVAANIQAYHVRYPIPAPEVQKDPALGQNTGY